MPQAILMFLTRNRRHLAELLLASLLINLLALALPLFSMLVYDKAVGNRVHDTLWALGLGVGLMLALELVLRTARVHLLEHAGARWDNLLDERVMRGVLATPPSRPLGAGELVGRLREVSATRDVLSAQSLMAVADLPFVLLFTVAVAVVAGPLVLVPLVLGGLVLASGALLRLLVASRQQQANEATRGKLATLVDTLAAREALYGQPAGQQALAIWRRQAQAGARAAARVRLWTQLHQQLLPALLSLSSVAVLCWGVLRIENQLLSVGGLISANMLAGRLMGTLFGVAPLATRWREFRGALEGLAARVDLQHNAPEAAPLAPAALQQEGLRLEALGLRFGEQGRAQLQGLNLHLPLGQIVAVVGASGAGKSTLLRLLAGHLVPTEGRLLAGGRRIDSDTDRLALCRSAFHKAQDPCFAGGLVRDVVAAGREGVSDEAVATALRQAGLGPQLDCGDLALNTVVGTNGAGLSGGQRQMVALATAFAGQQPLLLLDEPTLGLDRVAQEQLLHSLPALREGRCVLIATHAAELLQLADRVLVLDRGRVVADGPPARLLGQAPAQAAKPAAAAPQAFGERALENA